MEAAWRDGLRNQFAAAMTAERAKTQQLARLAQQRDQQHRQPDVDLLDAVPVAAADLTRLPEAHQRRLFDAFHLQVRYNVLTGEIILRATIHADTAPALAAVADEAVVDQVTNPLYSRHPHRFTGGGRGGYSVTRQSERPGKRMRPRPTIFAMLCVPPVGFEPTLYGF